MLRIKTYLYRRLLTISSNIFEYLSVSHWAYSRKKKISLVSLHYLKETGNREINIIFHNSLPAILKSKSSETKFLQLI